MALVPSLPLGTSSNIFQLTNSGVNTSTDVLSSRLMQLRPDGLSPEDDLLIAKLRPLLGRYLYLRFGQDALLNCPFCTFEQQWSFYAYWTPVNVLLPHLIHFAVLGVATSLTVAGKEAKRWRTLAIMGGWLLLFGDLVMLVYYQPNWDRATLVPPKSVHEQLRITRMVTFTIYDAILAGLIYLSATNRLFGSKVPDSEKLEQYAFALTTGICKIRAKILAAYAARMSSNKNKRLTLHEYRYWKDQLRRRRPIPFAFGSSFDDDTGRSIYKEEEPAKILEAINKGETELNLHQLEDDVNELVFFTTRDTHDW
ncbi:hypothetical protein KEM56_000115 [Ascosphaera pollenicola]|nr:hypothetical protein KEM56_000115 [Ascosphaera pollenicola]